MTQNLASMPTVVTVQGRATDRNLSQSGWSRTKRVIRQLQRIIRHWPWIWNTLKLHCGRGRVLGLWFTLRRSQNCHMWVACYPDGTGEQSWLAVLDLYYLFYWWATMPSTQSGRSIRVLPELPFLGKQVSPAGTGQWPLPLLSLDTATVMTDVFSGRIGL